MLNFKKTLRTTVLFLIAFALISVGVMQFYLGGANSYYQDSKERAALAGTLDYLLVGASHTERGFNTAIIDEELGVNCYNLGSPDLTMKGRYDILKKELARNPVKTVILEVSRDTLRPRSNGMEYEGELYYAARLDNMAERFTYLARTLKPADYLPAYQYYLKMGVKNMKLFTKGEWSDAQDVSSVYKGHARYPEEEPTDQTIKYKKKYKKLESEFVFDDEKVEYLYRIVELCKSYDVEIIMVSVPVSKKDICRKQGFDDYRQWYCDFAGEQGIAFYDFNLLLNRDELFDDKTSFADNDHLWNDAQDLFTEVFCEYMKRAEAGEDLSGAFFESYDAYERTQDYYPQ